MHKKLIRSLGWIVAGALALLIVLFALSNRHMVAIDLSPSPWRLDVPLFLAALVPLVFGVLVGVFVGWLQAGKARAEARTARRRLQELEAELAKRDADLVSAPDKRIIGL